MRIAVTIFECFVWLSALGYHAHACLAEELTIRELLSDVKYSTACGPISCFAAARYFGRSDASLDKMARLCNWSEGKTTTLQDMAGAIENFPGLRAQGVRLSPEQLAELLKTRKYAAILTVRRNSNEVNHAVCVFGDDAGAIISVDYPKLKQTWTVSRLADEWDGKALLISQQTDIDWPTLVLKGMLPGAAVVCLFYLAASKMRKTSESDH